MPARYVPDAGEIVWIDFTPQAGHQPAVVWSPAAYNSKTSLMICCPLTTQIKNMRAKIILLISGSASTIASSEAHRFQLVPVGDLRAGDRCGGGVKDLRQAGRSRISGLRWISWFRARWNY